MNKIINWTFGSLFRTFGRIIAYLLIGCLVAFFLSSSDFNLPKINLSDLFLFEKVNADTFDTLWLGELYQDSNLTNQFNFVQSTGSPAFMGFTVSSIYGGYFNKEFYHATRTISNANYIEYTYYFNNGSNISTSEGPQFSILAYIISPNQGTLWCDNVAVDTNSKYGKIRCPIKTQSMNIKGINVFVLINNNEANTFTFGLQASATIIRPSSNDSVTNAINSQTQQETTNANNIISNQNQTTQEIISNQEQNTQDIINNQESNTNKTIESQQVCKHYDKNFIKTDEKYLNSNGVDGSVFYGITDYISVINAKIKLVSTISENAPYLCFYNSNKSKISCIKENTLVQNETISVPSDASYVRFSINKSLNKPQFEICVNGNQALTDTMTDDDVGEAENSASDFFNDFTVSDHGGLSGIITAPLNTISNLVSNTCSPLVLPLPFLNENLSLPCLGSIYSEHFGAFYTIYQGILLAIISYRCIRSLFYDTRGFINPEDDRIEVLDL